MSKSFVRTRKCDACQHPEFLLFFDTAVPQADIQILTSFLEESVEEGTRYNDKDLITIGSMLFRVSIVNDSLTLEEPDLQSLPIEWKEGITESMKLLRLQKDIAESVGLEDEIESPSIRSSLLIGADLTQQDEQLVLERVKTSDSDSGWFVGRRDSVLDYDDEGNLKRISVYQAILNWPKIAGFLALPAGCRVDISATNSQFARNGRPLQIKPGSFVDVLANIP